VRKTKTHFYSPTELKSARLYRSRSAKKNLLESSDRGSHAKRKDNKEDQKEQQENEDGERSNTAKRTIAVLDRTPSSRKVVDLLEFLLITEYHAKRKNKQKGQG
jgi:hypothetical protein